MRLHGSPHTYASRYTDEALDTWAARTRLWLRRAQPADGVRIASTHVRRRASRDVYVCFDNDGHAHAGFAALRLTRRLGST